MFSRVKRQDGFTLTEVVVALAAVGIMAAAFVGLKSVVESSRVGSAIQAVDTIAQGAVQYAMTNGTYGGISWSSISNQELVPSGMMYPNWRTPWGGYYNVWADCNSRCFVVQLAYNTPQAMASRIRAAFGNRATTWQTNYNGTYAHVQIRFDR